MIERGTETRLLSRQESAELSVTVWVYRLKVNGFKPKTRAHFDASEVLKKLQESVLSD